MPHGPFLIFLLVFGYLQTGYWLAKLSWKVWYERETPEVLGHLLFPLSALWLGFGAATPNAMTPINEFRDPRRYELWMALFWPLKATANFLALVSYAAACAVAAIGLSATATLKLFVFGPERFARWMSAAARRGRTRSLGGIGGTLPVAVPQASPAAATIVTTEGDGHGT